MWFVVVAVEPEAIRRVLKPFMLTVNYRTRSMFKAKTITSRGAKSTTYVRLVLSVSRHPSFAPV